MEPTISEFIHGAACSARGSASKPRQRETARTTKQHPGNKLSESFWAFGHVESTAHTSSVRTVTCHKGLALSACFIVRGLAGMAKMHAAPYGALMARFFKRAVTREGVHALTRDSARKRRHPLPSPSQPGLGMEPTISKLIHGAACSARGSASKPRQRETARTTKQHPGNKLSESFWAFDNAESTAHTSTVRTVTCHKWLALSACFIVRGLAGMAKMHAAPYGALVARFFKRAVTREGVHALTRDSARKRGGPLPSPSQPGLGMVPTASGLFNGAAYSARGSASRPRQRAQQSGTLETNSRYRFGRFMTWTENIRRAQDDVLYRKRQTPCEGEGLRTLQIRAKRVVVCAAILQPWIHGLVDV